MFLRIESCNKDVIQGVTTDSTMYEVRISNAAYSQTLSYLCKGAKISLPDMRIKDDGTWEASRIIYEPDYLIDISSLSACFTESGAHPFHYLLSLLTPKELTKYILLGNTANQFLDDCINDVEGNCSYESSIKKAFTNEALKFTVCQGINASFFEDAKKQFANIRDTPMIRSRISAICFPANTSSSSARSSTDGDVIPISPNIRLTATSAFSNS